MTDVSQHSTAGSHREVDVVIVGYGPVGQYLAYKLGRLGYQVAAIERYPEAYRFPRAVHFDDEIGRCFQSIGLRPDDNPVIAQYDNPYRWVNEHKETILELDWRGTGKSGWHTSNFFHQPDLEREINAIVETEPRAQILRGWEVVAIDQDDAGVTATARHAGDGTTTTVRGRYLVGADGANSFVRRCLGVEMHDLGFEFDWLILDVLPHEEMHFDPPAWQWCRPYGPTTLVPGGPGRRRWEFMRMPGETIEALNSAETAWARLAEWGLTPDTATLERHTVYTFRAQWATRWRDARILLAGDAAHLMPPFAGQGMCSGIRDAENLLWKFDAVLSGRAPDTLLDTYGPEREEHVRYWIEFSMGLGRVICVSDPDAAAARDADMMAVAADPSLAPPPPPPAHLGPGVVGTHPGAGHLSVQGRIAVGGATGLFDDLVGYGWMVLARPGALGALSPEARAWADAYGLRLVEVGRGADVGDVDGTYTAWFDDLAADSVVVRPDFYVYEAAPAADLDAVLLRLRDRLTQRADAIPVA